MGVYGITMESITGESVDLSQFAGQHSLIVNVASF
jgi:glutathione peroxidase-family protein